jgi:protein gp37
MGKTTIEWCDFTHNGWDGCTKVSPGCAHCYAETLNHRWGKDNWGKGKPRRRTSEANWRKPIAWNKAAPFFVECVNCGWRGDQRKPCSCSYKFHTKARPRVFCQSIADWLDDEVPIEWLADLLKLIHDTPNLDWLLLTKRPENWAGRLEAADAVLKNESVWHWRYEDVPPENVWIGTSVEDQQRANERIPELLKIPANVRFLSVEPMLEEIGLIRFFAECECGYGHGFTSCPNTGRVAMSCDKCGCKDHRPKIGWAIFGGESGPGARPCNVEWIFDGVRQCEVAGVATFVKQLGAMPVADNANRMDWPEGTHTKGYGEGAAACRFLLSDKKGGDMSEWPEDLRIREFPK